MHVIPECKYCHGPMATPPGDETIKWSLRAVFKETGANGQSIVQDSPYVFSLNLFRCPTCGYLELFDDEI